MKVYIGPYKNWVGPYQIAEALCFWAKPVEDEYGFKRKPDWVHNFGTWLSHGTTKEEIVESKNAPETWLLKLCQWIESKRNRKSYIKIDKYDTWSMDHTLAMIVLPMLKQLKDKKHGAPFVEDEDVPEEMKSTSAPAKENEYDTDKNHFKRWDWALDEMIFAFTCKNDDSWQEEFRSGVHDLVWKPVDKNGNEVFKKDAMLFQMGHGPNDTYRCDYDGMKVVETRIQNGFRLFGKYYQSLWD
jgi:hypothetical protein